MSDPVKWRKGNHYEQFTVGQEFTHHWGRTINEGDNSLFSSLTLSYNPHYFNAEFAKAHGHPGIQVNPLLVFLTVFGLSVEDLSEAGGLFLGVEDLAYGPPVYPGDSSPPAAPSPTSANPTAARNLASSPGTRAATTSAANRSSNSTAPTS